MFLDDYPYGTRLDPIRLATRLSAASRIAPNAELTAAVARIPAALAIELDLISHLITLVWPGKRVWCRIGDRTWLATFKDNYGGSRDCLTEFVLQESTAKIRSWTVANWPERQRWMLEVVTDYSRVIMYRNYSEVRLANASGDAQKSAEELLLADIKILELAELGEIILV